MRSRAPHRAERGLRSRRPFAEQEGDLVVAHQMAETDVARGEVFGFSEHRPQHLVQRTRERERQESGAGVRDALLSLPFRDVARHPDEPDLSSVRIEQRTLGGEEPPVSPGRVDGFELDGDSLTCPK